MSNNDYVRPFMLSHGAVRGRIARLGQTSATITGRHDYPDAVSYLLSQLLALAAMLSSQLKNDGIVTIQLRGDGPVSLMVADAVTGGELRGYAEVASDTDAQMLARAPMAPRAMMGEDSYLAITLDQGSSAQRYQGVVALEGDSLEAALSHYFTNSQQLDVRCIVAAEKQAAGWSSGALLLERIAAEGGEGNNGEEANAESWRYAQAAVQTLTPEELLDASLMPEDILFRLFHEEGIEIFPETHLLVGCRCSRQRMLNLLTSMREDDKTEMVVDGKIAVHCQFCNQEEIFTPDEIGLIVN